MVRTIGKSTKDIIPIDDDGLLVNYEHIVMLDSRFVANAFEKRHDNVIQSIEKLINDEPEFTALNFKVSKYKDSTGRRLPCYLMTRDGFTMLAMGFTGAKARKFKIAYIHKFNELEKKDQSLQHVREMHPMLMSAIQQAHAEPKFYHYSNEMNLLNELVLGMSAKKFKELNGITDSSIRPYLTPDQLQLLDKLQIVDVGLVAIYHDKEDRKRALEQWMTNNGFPLSKIEESSAEISAVD